MPEICRFHGVVIYMFDREHAPPHFHARYAEFEAQFLVDGGSLLEGRMPRRITAMVQLWASLHRAELVENWARMRRTEIPHRIEPLA